MTTVKAMHNRAMEIQIQALEIGDPNTAKSLSLEAAKLEEAAAAKIPALKESEPTRSILYVSAASMAINAEDFELAGRMLTEAQRGFPEANQLRDICILLEVLTIEGQIEAVKAKLSTLRRDGEVE